MLKIIQDSLFFDIFNENQNYLYPTCFIAIFSFSHIFPSPAQAQYIVPVQDWLPISAV